MATSEMRSTSVVRLARLARGRRVDMHAHSVTGVRVAAANGSWTFSRWPGRRWLMSSGSGSSKAGSCGRPCAQAGPALGHHDAVLRVAGLVAHRAGKAARTWLGSPRSRMRGNVLRALVVHAADAVAEQQHGERAAVFGLPLRRCRAACRRPAGPIAPGTGGARAPVPRRWGACGVPARRQRPPQRSIAASPRGNLPSVFVAGGSFQGGTPRSTSPNLRIPQVQMRLRCTGCRAHSAVSCGGTARLGLRMTYTLGCTGAGFQSAGMRFPVLLGFGEGSDVKEQSRIRSTTVICVRRNGQVVMAADGQVTLGDHVLKHSAKKIRRLLPGQDSGRICRLDGRRLQSVCAL